MAKTGVLNQIFLGKIRAKLEAQAEELEREVEAVKTIPDFGQSEDDAVQEVEATLESNGLRTRLLSLLTQVKIALRLIDEGEYGVCRICHDRIEPARLEAMPTALTCVSCASKARP